MYFFYHVTLHNHRSLLKNDVAVVLNKEQSWNNPWF